MMRRMESSHADHLSLFLGNADHDPPYGGGSWSVMQMEESLLSFPESVSDNEQSSDKNRRLTSQQVHLLEKSFSEEKKLEVERKMKLANKLGLQPRQVAVWFQNRRARWKAKQLQTDYHQLKSSHTYLFSHYTSLLKHNQILKAQVDLLTKTLKGEYAPPSYPKSDYTTQVVNEGSPKQEQLLDLDYYYHCDFQTQPAEEEDIIIMDHHATNCLPLAHTTNDDEPLGWFWS